MRTPHLGASDHSIRIMAGPLPLQPLSLGGVSESSPEVWPAGRATVGSQPSTISMKTQLLDDLDVGICKNFPSS